MAQPRKLIRDGLIIEDQFRLVQQLGKGGMGTVWSAEDLHLGRPVAIKFLSQEFLNDPQARMRFAREPRLASKIRSPHVVQVYAQGTILEDQIPYLVMELLEGEDLAARITREGPYSLAEAGPIIEQVCRALSRAHREGLVHRDIKPHNIFLTPQDDGQPFVKLLDFGIAKDAGSAVTALTLTGEVVGSALYVSPEQLHEAHSVGPSTDIWSLGIVIYEMLTGRVPFDGRSLPELFMRVVEGKYALASELNPGLPNAVDVFFQQVIQHDAKLRFQSVDELAAAFGRIVRANSSGLLRKQETARAVPAVTAEIPAATPTSGATPVIREAATTERTRRPWPIAAWVALLIAGMLAAAIVTRMRREERAMQEVRPAAVAPASAGASEAPPVKLAPSPQVAQPPAAAAVVAAPQPAAAAAGSDPQPPAAAAPSPTPAARKFKAKSTPSELPTPASSKPMPQNHGF